VAWVCLNGCASSGLYLMSDDWCGRHPEASAARCGHSPHDVVQADPYNVVQVERNTGSQGQDDGS